MKHRTPVRTRLLLHREVAENGCWLWTGTKDKLGYGRMTEIKKGSLVHRVSYQEFVGPIAPGEFVCHNCPGGDNPSCFNPEHLYVGTAQDNNSDTVRKGRFSVGEGHYATTLSGDDVREIRRRRESGERQKDLAREYKVDPATISNIIKGVTWKHLV
jgi:hypothetical protein